MRRTPLLLALVTGLTASAAVAGPPSAPQAPVLTQPVAKGKLTAYPLPAATSDAPAYTADGDPSEWAGEPTFIGGTSRYSRGELVYTDYVGDDHGADDGEDLARAATIDPLIETADRAYRAEVLAQAAGEQFGAPDNGPEQTRALVADAEYGDADQGAARNEADITEVRLAADDENLYVLARFGGMADTARTALVIGFGLDPSAYEPGPIFLPVGHGGPGGLRVTEADKGIVVDRGGVYAWGSSIYECDGCAGAVNGSGFVNTIEASIPLSFVRESRQIFVASAISNTPGTIQRTRTGTAASDLINIAFREETTDPEPTRIWHDRDQAFALNKALWKQYLRPFDLDKLQSGANEGFSLSPGYYERVYVSDSPVNQESESGQMYQGPWQHYGIYLPTAYRPGRPLGVTWWTHYRGGHAHDAASWVPGLIHTLGEAQDRIVVSPSARGTSSWYVGRGYEDFLDVWDDVEASFDIDPERVVMSGYSMGGFASWLLPLTTPDRFAGAFPTSGPPTQGLWAGAGDAIAEQNGAYDADAELMFTIVENARNIRYAIYHGSNDELVPWTGVARMAARLTELGYEHRFVTMPGYEHYTHAIVDDWRDAAAYLETRSDRNPAHVTYRRWPALERAVNTVNTPVTLDHRFDGAYWVDGIELADPGTPDANGRPPVRVHGTVDLFSHGRGEADPLAIPEAGQAVHWTAAPFTGLRYLKAPVAAPAENRVSGRLTNVRAATLDLERMGLTPKGLVIDVVRDAEVTLTLVHPSGNRSVVLPAGSGPVTVS